MLGDLNETLKKLVVNKLGADGIDVSFEQPTREWSAKITRPTVNFFLLRLLENRQLRDLYWQERKENQMSKLTICGNSISPSLPK